MSRANQKQTLLDKLRADGTKRTLSRFASMTLLLLASSCSGMKEADCAGRYHAQSSCGVLDLTLKAERTFDLTLRAFQKTTSWSGTWKIEHFAEDLELFPAGPVAEESPLANPDRMAILKFRTRGRSQELGSLKLKCNGSIEEVTFTKQ